jgi:hypothetical protein
MHLQGGKTMKRYQVTKRHPEAKANAMAVILFMMVSFVFLGMGTAAAQGEKVEKGPASTHELLMKANDQLTVALHYAELAVSPHQPGMGWHAAQTQRAINILVGTESPDFNKEVENPGDGHGVMKYLQEAHDAMKGCRPVNTCNAIESALEYLRAALEHGKKSIEWTRMAGMEQRHARMFGALLRAVEGTRDTESAALGALGYAIRVTEHMAEH